MVYVLLADGFEDVEALAPIDVMRRAGIDVKTIGITGVTVTSSHGVRMFTDATELDIDCDTEMLVLPGGGAGTEHLRHSQIVQEAIDSCVAQQVPIAAICAAPSILGERGLLKGHRATCFPSFSSYLEGAEYTGEPACEDGIFITGKSAGHSFRFGLRIVARLRGAETAAKVAHAIYQED